MLFKRINKASLFVMFFMAFVVIGLIPFAILRHYTLMKVETEMKSSLNEAYYLMTEQIAGVIDQVFIQRWISNMEQLRSALDFRTIHENAARNALLNTFFRDAPEIVTLSLFRPNSDSPLHFIKHDRLDPSIRNDPEEITRLFANPDSEERTDGSKIRINSPIMMKKQHEIFLPVDVFVDWDYYQIARIRCIYNLSPVFRQIEHDMPFGNKEMVIVDGSGQVIFSNSKGPFSPKQQFTYPIMEKVKESLFGKARVFQLETFTYNQNTYVGNFATTQYLNWAVIVVEDYATAYALVRQTREKILLWAIIAIMLCIACSGFFSWFFSIIIMKARHALVQAKEAAESATRSKSEFLANMSHEIRTPMNAIMGFTDIMEEKIHEPQLRSYLDMIRSAGKALLTLINDILDLSKIEAGKLRIEYTAVRPRELFREIEGIFSPAVREKKLEWITDIQPDVPNALNLDEVRLRQILLNLAGNAVKFTDSGTIRLSARSEFTDTVKNKVNFKFSVEDTGIGIPQDQKELIFEAFEQQTGQNYSRFGGTGLGLTITRRLIEMMGGGISVISEPGKGSTFTVTLENISVVDESAEISGHEGIGIHIRDIQFDEAVILVADDLPDNRRLIINFLENYPFHFLEASNGKEAVDIASAHLPDLIFMDVKMPVMGGLEATKLLKSNAQLKDIPIIAVTASAMKASEQQASMVCNGYLTKPLDKKKLIAEMIRFLKYRVAAPQPAESRTETVEPAEALSHEEMKNLTHLVKRLDTVYMPIWEEIQGMIIMDEVKQFSLDLDHEAKTHGILQVSHYSTTLYQVAMAYDVNQVKRQITEFPEMVRELKCRVGLS